MSYLFEIFCLFLILLTVIIEYFKQSSLIFLQYLGYVCITSGFISRPFLLYSNIIEEKFSLLLIQGFILFLIFFQSYSSLFHAAILFFIFLSSHHHFIYSMQIIHKVGSMKFRFHSRILFSSFLFVINGYFISNSSFPLIFYPYYHSY